jgi:lysophospholipase L1-like esterase
MNLPTLFTRRQFALLAATSAGLFLAGCGSVGSVDPALRDPDKNSAIRPEPREPGWMKRHDGFVEIAKKGDVDVLFLGDSITDFWRREPTAQQPMAGKRVFDREFGSLRTANFGISGDRTQHVLWRIDNGELDGIKPKVIMLMISTNNTGFERDNVTPRNTPAQAAEGVRQIIGRIREKLPKTKILLLAVFPRGENPDNPQRKQVNEINAIISKFGDGKNVRFLDINQKFLTPDGTLTKDIMPDFLHPVEKGYEIWAAAVKQPLMEMAK